MNPHYYQTQKPKPEWKRKLQKLNPNAVNTIAIGLFVLYFVVYAIL